MSERIVAQNLVLQREDEDRNAMLYNGTLGASCGLLDASLIHCDKTVTVMMSQAHAHCSRSPKNTIMKRSDCEQREVLRGDTGVRHKLHLMLHLIS